MSSYGNHDEIMDQYNRLLDIFNLENNGNDIKKLISQETSENNKKIQQQNQQNRVLSGSRQSFISNYTTGPTSINDGLSGSAHDLRIQSDDDLKSYSTVNQRVVPSLNHHTRTEESKKQEDNKVPPSESSIMTSDQSKEFGKQTNLFIDEKNEEENVRNYYSNRNQPLLPNNKRNNKILSKISASATPATASINRQNDENEKQQQKGTNLIVNNQNKTIEDEGPKDRKYISTAQASSARSSQLLTNENQTTEENGGRLIKVGNKKLSAIQPSEQPPIQNPKASAFSLTYGKEIESSNENIDNGYYTMTHTTPYHHLMEEDTMPTSVQQQQKHKQHHKEEKQSEELEEEEEDNLSSLKSRKINLLKNKEQQQQLKGKNTLPTRKEMDKKHFQQQRILPVAKAYEGSDSGEEIDSLVLNERYNPQATASSNRSNKIPLESQKNQNQINLRNNHLSAAAADETLEDSYFEEPANKDNEKHLINNIEKKIKLKESKKMMQNEEEEEEEEGDSTLTSEASSVIYREKQKKPKASKR